MFRKLLFLLITACSANAMAQHAAIRPIKAEPQKAADTSDYKKMGAPMPELNMKVFLDTSKKETQPTASQKDTVVTSHKRKKKASNADNSPAAKAGPKPYMTNADFDNNANLLVMMFNPTCSHCEDQTELMEKNIFLFKKSKMIFLANQMMWDYLPNFMKSFHVFDYPTITVGSDSSVINKLFLYSALPQINIYDRERKLIRTFSGNVPIDTLKKYIE